MGDTLGVLRNDFGSDGTKKIGSEGNHIAGGIQCFGVRMSVDDGLVDGSECRHEGIFEAGLVEYLRFDSGCGPGRMGGGPMAIGVVKDQGPARSAFVVLPEPRGEAIDELQPRRGLVMLPGLRIDRWGLVGIFRHRNEKRTSVQAV
jgi:hypothetical protein